MERDVNERVTCLPCIYANAPGLVNSKDLELCMQSHS